MSPTGPAVTFRPRLSKKRKRRSAPNGKTDTTGLILPDLRRGRTNLSCTKPMFAPRKPHLVQTNRAIEVPDVSISIATDDVDARDKRGHDCAEVFDLIETR